MELSSGSHLSEKAQFDFKLVQRAIKGEQKAYAHLMERYRDSIYFLLQTFEHGNMDSSVVFPINNMSIVVFSAILAFVFFKEKLSLINWLGICASLLAIGIISFV